VREARVDGCARGARGACARGEGQRVRPGCARGVRERRGLTGTAGVRAHAWAGSRGCVGARASGAGRRRCACCLACVRARVGPVGVRAGRAGVRGKSNWNGCVPGSSRGVCAQAYVRACVCGVRRVEGRARAGVGALVRPARHRPGARGRQRGRVRVDREWLAAPEWLGRFRLHALLTPHGLVSRGTNGTERHRRRFEGVAVQCRSGDAGDVGIRGGRRRRRRTNPGRPPGDLPGRCGEVERGVGQRRAEHPGERLTERSHRESSR